MINFIKNIFSKKENELKIRVKEKTGLKNSDLKKQREIYDSINKNNKYKSENDFLIFLLITGVLEENKDYSSIKIPFMSLTGKTDINTLCEYNANSVYFNDSNLSHEAKQIQDSCNNDNNSSSSGNV